MIVNYDDIEFHVEQITRFDQDPIYSTDGVDYLYTHITLSVRALWSPRATSGETGNVAAQAIQELRKRLMTPRKQLWVRIPSGDSSDSKTILLSPLTIDPDTGDPLPANSTGGVAGPVDANNGPKPVGEPIIQLIGERTAFVDFTIETWVNETSSMRPILSHRWNMMHEIDEDFYTTRTISGEAVFRTDWLAANTAMDDRSPVSPDDFREYLCHPIPQNFQRKRVRTELSSDNTRLKYTLVDVEQPANIKIRTITSVKGSCAIAAGRREATWTAAGAAGAASAADWLNRQIPWGFEPPPIAPAVVNIVTFPKVKFLIHLTIRGSRDATKQDLTAAMDKALMNYKFRGTSFLDLTAGSFFVDIAIKYDMFEREVEVRSSGEFGLVGFALGNIINAGPLSATNPDYTIIDGITTREDGVTSNPPYGSFGTYFGRMISQALGDPDADPGVAEDAPEPNSGLEPGV
jgi:hypothetical protein